MTSKIFLHHLQTMHRVSSPMIMAKQLLPRMVRRPIQVEAQSFSSASQQQNRRQTDPLRFTIDQFLNHYHEHDEQKQNLIRSVQLLEVCNFLVVHIIHDAT